MNSDLSSIVFSVCKSYAATIGPVAQRQSGAESAKADNSHGRQFDPAADHQSTKFYY